MRTVVSTVLAVAVALALGCKKDEPAATQAQARGDAGPAASPSASVAETGTEASPALRLVDWLDPDAAVVVYWNLPADVDPSTLSVVFALPSRLERMLRDLTSVDEALDAVLPLDSPRPEALLRPEALGVAPLVAVGTYVLRPLSAPRAEVEQALAAAGLRATQTEGFTIYEPQPPFPWRVVFLTDDVVAFVPTKEIGTGLGPLTAGRDLPPSPLENELRRVLKEEPTTLFDLNAATPLVHFDLGEDVVGLALRIRPWQKTGMDVELRLQPSGDPAEAVAVLEKRQAPLETEPVQKLVERVAFTVDAGAVAGRLQLTEGDVAVLREAG